MLTALRAAAICVCASAALAQSPPLVRILGEELDRNFRILKEKGDPAPYFVAYSVTELEGVSASATLGALKGVRTDRTRILDVTVRVGAPALDNYHRIRGDRVQFTSGIPIPLEDSPAAIKQRLWLETDRVYRLASERLIKVRANVQVKAAEEDESADFSPVAPSVFSEPPAALAFTADQAARRARKLSSAFLNRTSILSSVVSLSAQREVRYMVSTEGTRIAHGRRHARLGVAARGKGLDGVDIALSENFDAEEPAGLPKDDAIAEAIERMSNDLSGMLRAPAAEPFVGPAILSGRAAAVLFHEIFGHRIEGHRQKDDAEGQTFTKSLNQRVLPDFLSVSFDPTRRRFENTVLNGWYAYDDEGVKAQPVTVVEKGILKGFLMSRSPIRGFQESNGHGRRAPGFEIASRQSNMLVQSSESVPEAKLRERLLDEIRRQNKPYGLYFREVTGGFTTTAREGLQAFKVIPVIVYRVYADGRPDELIRGADIVGTPLQSFSKIIAASDKSEVFNGYCGAESGSVPVAAVAPAVLISEIEVQMQKRSQERPPLLPAPPAGDAR